MTAERFDPETVLAYWFGGAARDPAAAAARQPFWFEASPAVDAEIRDRFGPWIDAARAGRLDAWTGAPRPALARVVLLDQFPRNAWRGSADAFSCDALALATARHLVASGQLEALAPVEQAFAILPFEHSESLADQRECVRLSAAIAAAAPAAWQPLLRGWQDYAEQHLALIERFGRFPHRNRALGRDSTPAERAYLGEGGATFGQG